MRQKECKIEERRYGSRNHGLWFRFKTKSKNGGRVTKVAQVFGIGGGSIYRWLERKELAATKVKYRISIVRYKRIVNKLTIKSRS